MASAWGVGRFEPDGTLDVTFGADGFVEVSYPEGAEPRAVGVDSSGGIHVVGGSRPGGAFVVTLARFFP